MTSAEVLLDSISPNGNRITTWILKFPRIILAELNTHKMFSRNAASSRAIPIKRMIEAVEFNPFIPKSFPKNCKGMQSNGEIDDTDAVEARAIWLNARSAAISFCTKLDALGVHKQISNRLLEPFSHTAVLLTATDFQNFFAQRAHKDAQPEFQDLAFEMLEKYNLSNPNRVDYGDFHIPFGDRCEGLTLQQKIKVCVARAARVSYNNFEGKIDYEKDYELHDKLIESGHFSPLEHLALCMPDNNYYGNIRGWKPYRKFLSNENKTDNRVIKKV